LPSKSLILSLAKHNGRAPSGRVRLPDDSVDRVANSLVNLQVTAPAAATVPALYSRLLRRQKRRRRPSCRRHRSSIDTRRPRGHKLRRGLESQDTAATRPPPSSPRRLTSTPRTLATPSSGPATAPPPHPPANIIVTASTFVDAQYTKMLNALESILHRFEALESPSRSSHSPPSSPSGPSSCSSLSIAVEAPVVSSSASRRWYKIGNRSPSLKGCMEWTDEYEREAKHSPLLEADKRNKNALPPDLWVFSLRQTAIEGGVSVCFQILVTMELAVTDAMWHGHAGIEKWIGLFGPSPKSIKSRSPRTSRPR
jgi:hypothetical protein